MGSEDKKRIIILRTIAERVGQPENQETGEVPIDKPPVETGDSPVSASGLNSPKIGERAKLPKGEDPDSAPMNTPLSENSGVGQEHLITILKRVPGGQEKESAPANTEPVEKAEVPSAVPVADSFESIRQAEAVRREPPVDLPPMNEPDVAAAQGPLPASAVHSGKAEPIGREDLIFNFPEMNFMTRQKTQKDEARQESQRGETIKPVLSAARAERHDGVNEKKISSMEIARRLAGIYRFSFYENGVYRFTGRNYDLCGDEDLEKLIYEAFKEANITHQGYKFLQDVRNFLKLEAKSRSFTEADAEQARKCIGFRNGYLHLDTMRFTVPYPALFIRNCLEVDYEPQLLRRCSVQDLKKISCPYFDRFVATLADGDSLLFDRIYEMIGYIVSNDCMAKKLFVLSGVSNSGKSRLGAFIQGLFDKKAVIAIPLGALADRFSLGQLPGKALCIDLELPATTINARTAAVIKGLTGGDAISAENKYELRKTFTCSAKLLYATNHPVYIDSREKALIDRFVGIPVWRTIPKEERLPNLLNLFEAERFLVVMKGLGYYRDLVKNYYEFSGNFGLNDAFIADDSGIVRTPEHMIQAFIEETCAFTGPDQWSYTDCLYQAFYDYYGAEALSIDYHYFSRLVNDLYSDRISKGKKRKDGGTSPVSVFRGIVMKESGPR